MLLFELVFFVQVLCTVAWNWKKDVSLKMPRQRRLYKAGGCSQREAAEGVGIIIAEAVCAGHLCGGAVHDGIGTSIWRSWCRRWVSLKGYRRKSETHKEQSLRHPQPRRGSCLLVLFVPVFLLMPCVWSWKNDLALGGVTVHELEKAGCGYWSALLL